jgi:membrane protease YdiL (CAAX protease family)
MLVFGLIHMSFNPDTIINELINLPSYILAGTILTIAYEKEGFAVSTYAHITNNLISFLLTIIEI